MMANQPKSTAKRVDNRTDEQKAQFFRAQQAAAAREIALNRGGTGELRKGISTAEFNHRKKRRKIAEASRKEAR